jgi:hypothetical protein
MDGASDPVLAVRVEGFEERQFGATAELLIDPRYIAEDVLAAAATIVNETFSFERRSFGQAVTAAEVITVLQGVEGVLAVDLNALYLISPEGSTVGDPVESVPPSFLAAAPARVDRGQVLKAELLLVDPAAVLLTPMEQGT